MEDAINGPGHTEARWVAFTQYVAAGRSWNVTIREGMDAAEINRMLNTIADATDAIAQVADPAPAVRDAVGSPQTGGGSRTTGGGVFGAHGASGGPSGASPAPTGIQVSDVSKVIISGTRDAPIVQMFSPNEKLKFPLFQTPAGLVESALRDRYPRLADEDLQVFRDCGFQMPVSWRVQWTPSPKNPKWKDLVTIIQDDLER